MLRQASLVTVFVLMTFASIEAGTIDLDATYVPVNLTSAAWNDTVTVSHSWEAEAYGGFPIDCAFLAAAFIPTYYFFDSVSNVQYELATEEPTLVTVLPNGSGISSKWFNFTLSNSMVPAGTFELRMRASGGVGGILVGNPCTFDSTIVFSGASVDTQSLSHSGGPGAAFTADILLSPSVHYSGPPETYSCTAEMAASGHDCNFVDVFLYGASNVSEERIAIVDLDATELWQSFVLRVETCDPSGWTVHIGDSITNNGYGGDSQSTQHDAEVQNFDGVVSSYSSDFGASNLAHQFANPVSGCVVQQYYVANDWFVFDPDAATSGDLLYAYNPLSFDFPAYDEADLEDPMGLLEDRLYVGINKTFNAGSRTGTGVQKACFYLSTSFFVDEAAVAAECGF